MSEISVEILTRAANGDIEAFEQVYKNFSDFVYSILLKITRNNYDAEEATQDTFMKMYHKLKTFRFRSSFKTWVYRIVVNTAINYYHSSIKKESQRVDFETVALTQSGDKKASEQEATQTFKLLLGGIAAISLLVGGIGIMNIMLVSVTERTREIGLRKSVGAKRRDILAQFLIESLVMSMAGGIIGIISGIGLGMGVGVLMGKTMPGGTPMNSVVFLGSVVLAFFFAVGIGIFFGMYPANKASKLDPVEALRYE